MKITQIPTAIRKQGTIKKERSNDVIQGLIICVYPLGGNIVNQDLGVQFGMQIEYNDFDLDPRDYVVLLSETEQYKIIDSKLIENQKPFDTYWQCVAKRMRIYQPE